VTGKESVVCTVPGDLLNGTPAGPSTQTKSMGDVHQCMRCMNIRRLKQER